MCIRDSSRAASADARDDFAKEAKIFSTKSTDSFVFSDHSLTSVRWLVLVEDLAAAVSCARSASGIFANSVANTSPLNPASPSDEEDDASPPRAIGGRSSSDEDDMVITSVIASQRLAERASSRTKPPLFFPSLAAVASRKFLLFI